jgi:WD40 repeat protein
MTGPTTAALSAIWTRGVFETGAGHLIASDTRVVLGTGTDSSTDAFGSLMVLDGATGDVRSSRHDDLRVEQLELGPDQRWFVVAEFLDGLPPTNVIRVVDIDTNTERCRHNGNDTPFARQLAVSPDGQWVAVIASPPNVENQITFVFDAQSGAEQWRSAQGGNWNLAWSPGADAVAIGDQSGMRVADARNGNTRAQIPSPSGIVSMAFTSDGARIAAGCLDGAIRVFDIASATQQWQAQLDAPTGGGFTSAVQAIAVSNDQQWVAGLTRTNLVGVFDLAHGSPRYPPIACDAKDGNQLIYSPTLRHILAVSHFREQTDVIDTRTGQLLHAVDGYTCLPPGGNTVVAAAAVHVAKFDLGVAISKRDVGPGLSAITISPSGTPMVAVADTTAAVSVLDAATGTLVKSRPYPGVITAIGFADSGQAIIVGGSTGARLFSIAGEHKWSADDIGAVNALNAVGPAGDSVAVAAGKTLRLLASADGQLRWPAANVHPGTITRMAVSADGAWIATGCIDRKTHIVEAATGTEKFATGPRDGKVTALAFLPAGSVLATANEDGTVALIDAADSAQPPRLITRPVPCVRVAFSVDASLMAVADVNNTITVYDLNSANLDPLQEFSIPGAVTSLALHPVENSIVVAYGDATAAIYDARRGTQLVRILHPQPVHQLAVSTDGAMIATACDDGAVRVWAG